MLIPIGVLVGGVLPAIRVLEVEVCPRGDPADRRLCGGRLDHRAVGADAGGIDEREVARALTGDDVDHAGYSIAAVEGGRGTADHLDAVDPRRVDDVEIDLPAEVAHQPLAVDEDQDVPAREATHLHRGAHIAPAEVY